jgi:hypothetical protein
MPPEADNHEDILLDPKQKTMAPPQDLPPGISILDTDCCEDLHQNEDSWWFPNMEPAPPMRVIKTLPKDFSKITQIGKQKIICSPQEPQGDSPSKGKVIYHMLINQTAFPGAALYAHQEAISSPSTGHRTCPSPMQQRSRHFLHHPGGHNKSYNT